MFQVFLLRKCISCIDTFSCEKCTLNICLSFSVHITKLKNVVLGEKNASMLFQVPFKKLFQLAVQVSLRFQRTFQIPWFEIKVNEVAPLYSRGESAHRLQTAPLLLSLLCFYLSILLQHWESNAPASA